MRLFLNKLIVTRTNYCNTIAQFYVVYSKNLQNQYKEFLSDFNTWDRKYHAKQWLLYPENIGKCLSIDEISLFNRERYTILANKAGKCMKVTLAALIGGTKAETELL